VETVVVNAPYVNGAYEYIIEKDSRYKLFISTGTPQNEMIKILKKKYIDMYFRSVYGSTDHKINHVKEIVMTTGYTKEEIIFIGEADTDIIAAKENGIPIIFREHLDGNCAIAYSKMIKVKDLTDLKDNMA